MEEKTIKFPARNELPGQEPNMDLQELLDIFASGDIVGEDPAVIQTMRYYSRQAQKITI